MTLDIETFINDNNEMIPYCICVYDGNKNYSYYLTDYNNYHDMIKIAISSLLKPKYNNYKIYIHNLSNFDATFFFLIYYLLLKIVI
jgi:hypothetical protein